jgi:multidrug resistance efflux pump
MKNSKLGIFVIAVLVVLAIGLAVLGPMLSRREAAKAPTMAQQTTAGPFLAAKGIVESEEDIMVGSVVAGRLTNVMVDDGDFVKKGQPLATLDSRKLMAKISMTQAELQEAKAHLKELERGYRKEDVEMAKSRLSRSQAVYANARDEYERQKRLFDKNAATLVELNRAEEKMKVSAEELDEAKADVDKFSKGARAEDIEMAKASVGKASADLKYNEALLNDYTILSPIDGLVAARLKNSDETVEVGTPVLKLVNPEKLRIRAEVEETDVDKVKNGEAVEVYADAYKDRVYHGRVYKVFSVVRRKAQRTFDPSTSFDINTQGIYIRLDDFSGLKDGMTVTVRFLK